MDLSNLIYMVADVAEEATHGVVENEGFVGTLGLNWKLFVAQLLNFAVVLFILWKWVFGPIAKALEDRRKRIEESVDKAEKIEKQMKEFEQDRDMQLTEARSEAQKIIKEAQVAAEASRAEIVKAAQGESEKIIEKAKQAVVDEKEKAMKELREELATLTLLATEKIIRSKLDEKTDRMIIEDTIKNIDHN